jgi:tetratricopeptide (TPR) repeat protein/tRNA A-37 threonylcarbamoyl transferase component Bud32
MPVLTQDLKEQRLDEILASYLNAAQLGQAPDADELFEQNPDLRPELQQFFKDQEVVDRLTAPLRSVLASPAETPGQSIGDYELVEKISQGGMGVVWRAVQKSLNRVVALKMMRAGRLATPADRRRFRREAEAVAQLDHPHIVPIYEVGEHDGALYFSMKLFEGGSVAQHRARFQNDSRGTARLLATVTSAVHYAHQRGILHRDLKPANILLDERGAAHVGDFGLAKRMAGSAGTVEASGVTQVGSIIGTPSYMAPEQAAGRPEAITTAADVYSLGAILYDLLTGRPPFREATLLDTLRSLLDKEPARPRSLNPRADRDLETICLKCLEKEPARRYASAQELTDDLERYLAGEPIQARPLPRMAKIWRWCRRQPLLAGVSAALLLSFVLGFGAVAWQWRRAADHLVQADREKARADESFRLAHQAVNDMLTRVTEAEKENLTAIPGRKELLQDALKYYQTFLEQRGNDPAIQRDLADAFVRLGLITSATGSKQDALVAYQQALDLYQKLQAAQPKDQALRAKLPCAWHNVGVMQSDLGQATNSWASYQQAKLLYEEFLKDSPREPLLLGGLSNTLGNMGIQERGRHRSAEALALFREANAYQEKLVRLEPNERFARNALAATYSNLGSALEDHKGKEAEALAAFEKARSIREDLVQQRPDIVQFQHDLAETHHNVAVVLRRLGQQAEAQASDQKAHAAYEKLAQDQPGITKFRQDLAGSYFRLGQDHRRAGRKTEALSCLQQARAIQEKLAKADPNVPAYRKDLAATWFQTGVTHAADNNKAEALLCYQKARELYGKLVEADGDNLAHRAALGAILNNLGVILGQRNEIEEAVTIIRECVQHKRFAFDRAPQVDFYRFGLYSAYGSFGEILREAGLLAEVADSIEKRRKLYPDHPQHLFRMAGDWGMLTQFVAKGRKEPTEPQLALRQKYADNALATLRQAIQKGFQEAEALQKEAGFDGLRSREDFQKLLTELNEKANRE